MNSCNEPAPAVRQSSRGLAPAKDGTSGAGSLCRRGSERGLAQRVAVSVSQVEPGNPSGVEVITEVGQSPESVAGGKTEACGAWFGAVWVLLVSDSIPTSGLSPRPTWVQHPVVTPIDLDATKRVWYLEQLEMLRRRITSEKTDCPIRLRCARDIHRGLFRRGPDRGWSRD